MIADSLKLLQLADSALPVGALSHSFGLESMTEEGHLTVDGLFSYISDLLQESLLLDAVYCRAAVGGKALDDLNRRFSALRLARESRLASLALGRRFLKLVCALEPDAGLEDAAADENHFVVAFGFACGSLGFSADQTVMALLHQSVWNIISAAQRLLPLGQQQAHCIAWDLKPAMAAAVEKSTALPLEDVICFAHLPEVASMRHPALHTRLFIS
jgi:urease accessory protein